MLVLAAGAPLLFVIAAVVLRQSATRAAFIGLAAAVGSGMLWFGFDGPQAVDVLAQWWPTVLEVLAIVAGGIFFAEAGRRTGGQLAIAHWLRENLGVGVAPVLAIVHGVTPLAEALSGFGIGLAIGVPILFALGYGGRKAAILGLLGLSVVPWGSMGPGTLVAARLGGVAFDPLGLACAALSLPVFLGTGIAAALMVTEKRERARGVIGAVASGIVLWASILGANALFGTAPAGSVGAAVTLALHLAVHRLRAGRLSATRRLLAAVLPYAVLLGGVLVTSSVIRAVGLTGTPWHLLSSPALWLLTAGLVALRSRLRDSGSTAAAALRAWLFVGPATGLFILLGAVMAECGMSQTIAAALASLGSGYLAAIPLIGGLGGFVSGSNSGSNAMFAGPQSAAGVALGVSPLGVTAMQNVAGSLFIMSSPARVEFATRLCPDPPRRGSVMRGVLRVDLVVVTVLAGLSLLLLPRW